MRSLAPVAFDIAPFARRVAFSFLPTILTLLVNLRRIFIAGCEPCCNLPFAHTHPYTHPPTHPHTHPHTPPHHTPLLRRESLGRLGLHYIDLYLIHWPWNGRPQAVLDPSLEETWGAMEGLVRGGLAR